MTYLPLQIAACTTAGGSYSNSLVYSTAFDTYNTYGLMLQHSTYAGRAKAQNIISQQWKDQDGDDTYIPSTITHESQEIEYTLVYLRNDGLLNTKINSFITAVEGRWLKIYDSYTQQGFKAAYLTEFGDIEFRRRGTNEYATIKVKFKVNDPTIYTSNNIFS